MPSEKKLKEEITLLGRFLYERGFFFATTGNISARMREVVFITPRGRCKGELSPKEISKISLKGKVISGEPSSEWRMHLGIYGVRQSVKAVIHAHSPFATFISFLGKLKILRFDAYSETHLGEIRFISYFKPGSEELAEAVAEAVGKNPESDIFILKRHGAVVLGKDLKEARLNLERLEFFARLFWLIKGYKI
ncbi:MAG: class II aldolase/adducin family protein [candidate division WOR-3 bacterium]